MRSFVSEASFWVAVALAGVLGVFLVKLAATGPVGKSWPGFQRFALTL